MPKIIQLSPHVANLIAAGEVVERPASVVKELLENAVDAGAHRVTVEIENGGMGLIRVTDDGCGMTPEDAETAFLRHATSKIRTEADLAGIHTLGFRGEALAAIASVSRIDILTRPAGAADGASLHLEGGTITERLPAGCPEGTSIFVRNLFFNTPARMKFMKRDSVEAGAVAQAVQNQAFAHPEVGFRLFRDGQAVLATPGDGDLRTVIYQILGRKTALEMVPVSGSWGDLRLSGFVSAPADTRGTRAAQYFFVNDRPVKSRLLMAALEQAYQNQLLPGRFPSCVLHLRIPDTAVDVNVHPAKTEIKFLNERDAFDCLHYGVRAALEQHDTRPAMELSRQKPEAPAQRAAAHPAAPKQDFFRTMNAQEYKAFSAAMENAPKTAAPEPLARRILSGAGTAQAGALPLASPVQTPQVSERRTLRPIQPVAPTAPVTPAAQPEAPKPTEAPKIPEKPEKPEKPAQPEPQPPAGQQELPMPQTPDWRIVGEVLDTYLLIEQGQSVLFIDKHAAHERILFEKYRAQAHAIVQQELLAPITAQLGAQEAAAALGSLPLLEQLGFVLTDVGDGTVLIRAVPADLDAADAPAALEALCADLLAGKTLDPEQRRDILLHTVACKAAIKGGWKTHAEELEVVAREVMTRSDLRYCPHGRPICIELTAHQIEKQFKRT